MVVALQDRSLEAGCWSGLVSEETMSFEEGDCFQSCIDGELTAGYLQKPKLGVLSAFLGIGADRRWDFGANWVEG